MINTKFWDDTYIITLSSNKKLLFIYLITSGLNNVCGIYEISIKRICFDTDLEKTPIEEILAKFSEDDKIYYIDGWIYIKNFQKHQTYNENMKIGVKKCIFNTPNNILTKIREKNKGFEPFPNHSEEIGKLEPKLEPKLELKEVTEKLLQQLNDKQKTVLNYMMNLGFQPDNDFKNWLEDLHRDYSSVDFVVCVKEWHDYFKPIYLKKKKKPNYKLSFRNWVSKPYATKKENTEV